MGLPALRVKQRSNEFPGGMDNGADERGESVINKEFIDDWLILAAKNEDDALASMMKLARMMNGDDMTQKELVAFVMKERESIAQDLSAQGMSPYEQLRMKIHEYGLSSFFRHALEVWREYDEELMRKYDDERTREGES
jgi:hypothetical protein